MADRMSVNAISQDIYQFYQKNNFLFPSYSTSETEIKLFVQTAINEPIPSSKTNQFTDAGVVYKTNPEWPLKKIKDFSSETIGLEEQFNFFQLYCQTPRGGDPLSLPIKETPIVCSYFKSKWQKKFPTEHHSMKPASLIPLKSNIVVEDGDTATVCFDEKEGECHVARYTAVDTQESVETNDFITEINKKRLKNVPTDWDIKETMCYTDEFKKGDYCVLHVSSPNTKMTKQGIETWKALINLIQAKDPALAFKLSNKELLTNLQPALISSTKYRGKLATLIHKSIVDYVNAENGSWFAEPSYAVPDAWNDVTKNDGHIEGICYFGRLLLWITLEQDSDLLAKYLGDKKNGLSAYAEGKLKEFYTINKTQLELELGKINFGTYGLTPAEIKLTKELLMTLVIDPSTIFSSAKADELKAKWKNVSTQMNFYKYTNNLNFLMIFLGLGIDTANYPNIRGKTSWFLKKYAADEKHGLFASPAFFQTYATKKQREDQLKEFSGY